uniref:Putative ribonuclease H-like domain-containing protein n=1 Tax=Tanacetum cinerariifolium TaxID=118510 RepID=A0A6L2JZ29_TANCI|nr:putative ribonuclease H-like domain-containing protein [Tanacetum cinerariifolium]
MIFKYLKGKPHLGLWYPKDSLFDLVAYSDSDYAGASLDRKSTTEGCQFLGCRLISWQCKKQTVMATSSTEAEYVAAVSCVNTPRCDDDMLELMKLTIFLLPNVEKVGIEVNAVDLQVSAVRLMLLLLVQKFMLFGLTNWCCSLSAVRLQALVDKKKVVVTEATIREALRLDDADGVECLPNEEIFAELARMGYEKPSIKLTSSMASAIICLSSGRKFNFSKYIFESLVRNVDSPSKFYMYHRFLQLMIRKQVGDLSTHTTKYTSPALTQKVFANMRRVGNGFSEDETPLFEGMLVEQQVAEGDADEVQGEDEVPVGDVTTAEGAAAGDVSAANDEVPTADEEPSIPSPTPPTPPPQPSQDIPSTFQAQPTPPQSPQVQPPSPQPQPQPSQDARLPMNLLQELLDTCTRVKKLERKNKVKVLKLRRLQKVGTGQRVETSDDIVMDDVSNQERMIAEMDQDADVVLEETKEVVDDAKAEQDAKVDESVDIQKRQAESQAEIYKIDFDHANKVLSMHEEESEPVESQKVVDIVTTAKLITKVVTVASTTVTAAEVPVTTTDVASKLTAAPSRRTKGVVIRDPKETTTTSTIIHTEAKSKDKGKRILVEEPKPLNKQDLESWRRKEPKPLKKQAQIEQDEKYARELEAELNRTIDWDEVIDHVKKKAKEDPTVNKYQVLKRMPQTEAQARKNMMIYLKNVVGFKMDYFKGIDDLEALWSLVKERFATTKPKNFSDDYLLVTLGAIFGVDAAMDLKKKHAKYLMLLVKDLVLPSQDYAVD